MDEGQSLSALEDHVGYWLRTVSNYVSSSFAARLSSEGVSVAEWVLLRETHRLVDPAPSLLAERMGMTRGAISKMVDRLAERDLLEQVAADGDRRFQTVRLTTTGFELLPRLAKLADENDAEFFGHLQASERDHLISTFRELAARYAVKTTPTA